MKQLVKAMSRGGECFRYRCGQFLGLFEPKLKKEIFVETDIKKLIIIYQHFEDTMETESFETGFLGTKQIQTTRQSSQKWSTNLRNLVVI